MSFNHPIAVVTLIIGFLVSAFVAISSYYKRKYSYWEQRKVPCFSPKIPWGNIDAVVFSKTSLGELLKELYDKYKADGYRHAGMYFMARPTYVPIDPEIIKCILVKDFQNFNDRGLYHDEVNDPLSAHMFSLPDQKWKNMRVKISPTFSTGKLKAMYGTIVEVGRMLSSVCEEICASEQEFEVKDLLARFTSDVIGSCALGIDCNSLKNPKADFIQMGKRVFEHSKWDAFKVFISKGFSNPGIIMKFFTIDTEAVQFFHTSLTDTIAQREESKLRRNDFLQMIIDLKKKSYEGPVDNEEDGDGRALTMNEIAAQAFLMYIAGYDTSATTASFCLYEIIKNQEIQDRMREEIRQVLDKCGGVITYDACNELKYVEKVIYETIRKYPTLPYLNRYCIKDFKVPDSDLVIEKDTPILVPVMGLHRDPEYFPDPDLFDPERFSEENKTKIPSFAFLPFGEGPRNCIGSRFGILSLKVAFSILLENYKFTLSQRTREPLKIVSVPQNHLISIEGGLWAKIHKI